MSTHVYGLTVAQLVDAECEARAVDHSVTLVDDAAHVVVVVDQAGHVIARPDDKEARP